MVLDTAEAKASLAEPFPLMITEAVRAAVVSTFQSICGNKPEALAAEQPDARTPGVVGLISFAGDAPWMLCLMLPPATLAAVTEKFIGVAVDPDSPDVGDAVGELVNVLAGDVCAELDRRRISAQMSLPAVVRGQDVELLTLAGVACARLAFRSDEGPFWFKLTTAKNAILPNCRRSGG